MGGGSGGGSSGGGGRIIWKLVIGLSSPLPLPLQRHRPPVPPVSIPQL